MTTEVAGRPRKYVSGKHSEQNISRRKEGTYTSKLEKKKSTWGLRVDHWLFPPERY